MPSTPEPFSRILIDKALEASGWNLLDPQQVRFEVHAGGKRADYVLMDEIGRVLCVLEAKRADHDPYDAKEQARLCRKSESAVHHPVERDRALVLELRARRSTGCVSHRAHAVTG